MEITLKDKRLVYFCWMILLCAGKSDGQVPVLDNYDIKVSYYDDVKIKCSWSSFVIGNSFLWRFNDNIILDDQGPTAGNAGQYAVEQNNGYITLIVNKTDKNDVGKYVCNIATKNSLPGALKVYKLPDINNILIASDSKGHVAVTAKGIYPPDTSIVALNATINNVQWNFPTAAVANNTISTHLYDFKWTSTEKLAEGSKNNKVSVSITIYAYPQNKTVGDVDGETTTTTTTMGTTTTTQPSNTTASTSSESTISTLGNTSPPPCNLTSDLGTVQAIIGGSVGGYVLVIIVTPCVLYLLGS